MAADKSMFPKSTDPDGNGALEIAPAPVNPVPLPDELEVVLEAGATAGAELIPNKDLSAESVTSDGEYVMRSLE